MNTCCRCGDNATIGLDFIPYYDYEQGFVEGKFRQFHCFCDVHFLLSYHAFYISTSVGWEISYSFSDNKEVREIVADSFRLLYEANNRHSDGSGVVRNNGVSVNTDGLGVHTTVRDAWSDNRPSDTKSWHKPKSKGGKK